MREKTLWNSSIFSTKEISEGFRCTACNYNLIGTLYFFSVELIHSYTSSLLFARKLYVSYKLYFTIICIVIVIVMAVQLAWNYTWIASNVSVIQHTSFTVKQTVPLNQWTLDELCDPAWTYMNQDQTMKELPWTIGLALKLVCPKF